jgi:hypothetical protein
MNVFTNVGSVLKILVGNIHIIVYFVITWIEFVKFVVRNVKNVRINVAKNILKNVVNK